MNERQKQTEENLTPREALLRELALRLTIYPADPFAQDPQLYPEQLPPGLNTFLPLPEGCRLLGSLIRSPEQITIVLDALQSPEQVLTFYREQMKASGWQELDETMRPFMHGFTHTTMRGSGHGNTLTLCQGQGSRNIFIQAFTGTGSRTDVRINLNSGAHSPCNQRQRRMRHMHPMREVLPLLVPPQGTRQQPGGGGGNDDRWYSTASLISTLDVQQLADHYQRQLEAAGWKYEAKGGDQQMAWSTWTFTDEDQQSMRGLFLIVKTPGREQENFLYVQAQTDTGEGQGGQTSTSWLTLSS